MFWKLTIGGFLSCATLRPRLLQHHQLHRGDPVTPQNSVSTNVTFICNVVIYINIRLIQAFVLFRNPKVIIWHLKFGAFLLCLLHVRNLKELWIRGQCLILLKYSFQLTDCFYVILWHFPACRGQSLMIMKTRGKSNFASRTRGEVKRAPYNEMQFIKKNWLITNKL